MSKNSADLMSGSLRSRIWLAVAGLAILNCIFGLVAYLAASFFTSNTFAIVFAPFVTTSICTMIFGRWMSNEMLRPLEKVSLLAKSLERGSAVSLPKTTGAAETDELLQTLHRSSRQMQNLIGMMDSVSSGNTEIALTPIENADRLSASFQKLVSRVTNSVDSAKELESLQTAVRQLASDLSAVKSGNMNCEIRGGFAATSEISGAVRILLDRQSELVQQVWDNSDEAGRFSLEAKKLIRHAIENDGKRVIKLSRAAEAFKQNPTKIDRLSAQISAALSGTGKSVEDFEAGKKAARQCKDAVQTLRKEITAAVQKIERIEVQSAAIAKISKLAGDLARRSNLIALNASVQAGSANGGNVSLIADEVTSLSERASYANKEVTIINETITREIGQAQNALDSLSALIAEISAVAAKGDDAMTQLLPFFEGIAGVPSMLETGRTEISLESRQLLSVLAEYSSDADASERNLKDCEELIAKFDRPLDELHDSVAPFRTLDHAPPAPAEFDFSAAEGLGSLGESVQLSESFEIQGEN